MKQAADKIGEMEKMRDAIMTEVAMQTGMIDERAREINVL